MAGSALVRRVTASCRFRTLAGCSRSQLLLADDELYVTKLCVDAASRRLAINELLAAQLAQQIQLPIPSFAIVIVPPDLQSWLELPTGVQSPRFDEVHFGSRHLVSCGYRDVFEFIPKPALPKISNLSDFSGAYVFDKWLANSDRRQFVVGRRSTRLPYTVFFIDNGHCFGGEEWACSDLPLAGQTSLGPPLCVFDGHESAFAEWIGRIEALDPRKIWECADEIPETWLKGNESPFSELVELTVQRIRKLRDLVREGAQALKQQGCGGTWA